jgi:glycosyltransferase involved in cell wall biosynthesis
MTAAQRDLSGMDVEVATTDVDGPGGRLTEADLPKDSVTVHLFPGGTWESLKYSRDLGRWLNAHACEYDIIQTHSNWNYPVAAACQAANRAGVPYVIRPCGMLSDYTWQKSKWRKRAWWWLRERGNVRNAAGFHVTSREERQEVLRLGVTAPVDVIPLGIGNDAWETPVDLHWLRQQCPRAGNRPIVLFLSRLHPKKGVTDYLLPALAQLKTEAYLAIIGGEDSHAPGFVPQIENEIHRRCLDDKVALLGPILPHRRWAAFDGADLFVLPSHTENFGIVVPEAMARGKPVVVTTGVQFGEHVTASGGGIVVRPDVGELAASLDFWLADSSRRIRAGESGRRYIQNHFTWRQTAANLADLYDRVSNSQRPTPGFSPVNTRL